jgi:hypothetical protein
VTAPSPTSDDDRTLADLLDRWYALEESGEGRRSDFFAGVPPPVIARFLALVGRASEVAGTASDEGRGRVAGLPAQRIGRFELVEERGGGGFARVFLAEDPELGRPVALKVLRPHHAEDPVARRRFRLEGEIVAALDHPGIVPILETGEDGAWCYLALKWIEGGSLAPRAGKLSPEEAARIGAVVARALHAAHERGIVHRDVKPANVLMDGDAPKLTDFGLAHLVLGQRMTASDTAPGTLAYLAPEVLAGAPAEPRVDVWSLGATLYELVRGEPPFGADGAPESTAARIATDDPPSLGLKGADRDFEAIVRRALEKEPARRFPTAADMADDLERYVAGQPILSRRSGIVDRLWRRARRRPKTAATVVVAALCVLGAGGFLAAARWRDDALFAEDLGRVTHLVDAQRTGPARRGLEAALARRPTSSEALALRARIEGLEAVDALLDALHDLNALRDAAPLRRALAAVEALPAAAAPEPLAVMARAAAAAQLADADALVGPLRALDGDRRLAEVASAVRALAGIRGIAAAAAPEAGAANLPPAADLAVESTLVRALTLRLANAPVEERLRLIDTADPAVAAHPRLRRTRARVYEDAGDPQRAASVLEGLADDGTYPPAVAVALARIELRRGDADRSRRWLALADFRGAPTIGFDSVRADLALKTKDPAYPAILAACVARWPEDPYFLSREAHLLREKGAWRDAAERFRRAAKSAPRAVDRGVYDLNAVECEVDAAIGGPGDERDARLSAALRALDARAAVGEAAVRAEVHVVRARVFGLLGRLEEAYAATGAALAASPDHPRAVEARATAVVERTLLDAEAAGERGFVAEETKAAATAVLAALEKRIADVPNAVSAEMYRAAALLAIAADVDTARVRTAIERYGRRPGATPDRLADLEAALAELEGG